MNEQKNIKEIELLPLREAMDYAQSLESRGDFKFKGIYAIFNAVFEATSRFNATRILPDLYQLQKELNIPKEKFEMYLNELLGKGSLKSSAIISFPALDYISGGNFTTLLLLCRPLQQDGTSYRKYYDYYKNRTIDAIKKWMQKKGSKWDGPHRDYIIRNLNDENYFNSHAGAVIQYYLKNPLDKSQEDQAITYKNYVKPIIQDLINDRVILYLKDDFGFYTLQFPDEESLIDRFKLLVHVLSEQNNEISYSGNINYKDLENYKNKIQNLTLSKHKNLFLELKLILNELIRISKQKEEQSKKQLVQKVIEELSRYDYVVPSTYIKSINHENFYDIISSPDILHTEYMYAGKLTNFLLYKKNVYPAVVHARKQLFEKHNDLEMKILMHMDIARLLEGEQLKVYLSAEEEVLFMRLPLIIRILRILFGKNKVKNNEEKEKLKEEVRREEIEKQIEFKKKEAVKKTKEIARKKVEETVEDKPEVDLYEQDVNKLKETIQKDEKIEKILEKVLDVLDNAWDNKELPNRITLLENIEEFQHNEDYLIQFLKKYAKGKIFSFRIIAHNPNSPKINLNDPKYMWPILITKRYIIKNGHKLLKQAMDEVDEQKNALMPDQEKFDVAVSIEDFLNRVLSNVKKR